MSLPLPTLPVMNPPRIADVNSTTLTTRSRRTPLPRGPTGGWSTPLDERCGDVAAAAIASAASPVSAGVAKTTCAGAVRCGDDASSVDCFRGGALTPAAASAAAVTAEM